jgi:hypothetical protein
MKDVRRLTIYCLIAAVLSSAGGCGGDDSDSPAPPACPAIGGHWAAQFDVGGLVGHQDWTISQTGCSLTVVADPGATQALGLPATGTTGYTWNNGQSQGLRLSWSFDNGPCRTTGFLDAALTGNDLAGSVIWFNGPHGAGYCAGSGSGSYPVTAKRL